MSSFSEDKWDQQSGDNNQFEQNPFGGGGDQRWKTDDRIEQIYTDLSNTIFGRRVPMTAGYLLDPGYRQGVGKWHSGIDMSTPIGEAVRVPVGGTIVRGIQDISGDYFIGVRSDDGKLWIYGHLGSVSVPSGRIEAGQIIGRVGSAAHLHLEVQAGPNYRSSQNSNQNIVRNATLNPIKSFWELRNR
ncbi:MAG: M23 family metallopeptidase [Microcoleus sp. SM1_3_4]|nr:M23 family metallopeptidase [Microcoleus sp. SM1_3_4]